MGGLGERGRWSKGFTGRFGLEGILQSGCCVVVEVKVKRVEVDEGLSEFGCKRLGL